MEPRMGTVVQILRKVANKIDNDLECSIEVFRFSDRKRSEEHRRDRERSVEREN